MAKKKNKKPAKKSASAKKKPSVKRKPTPAGRKPSGRSKRSKPVKKRAVKLKPIKRTITRKKSKKTGKVYYKNKKTGKFTTKKAWKGLNTRIRTRKEEIEIREKRARIRARKKKVVKKPKKKKVVKKKPTRFNRLQRIFKKYLDTAKIKVGKRFNEYVGNIYRATLDLSLKDIKERAGELWDKFSGFEKPVEPPPVPEKLFPESFAFYMARDEFRSGIFEGVNIIISVHDPDNDFDASFEGGSDQFSEWYSFSGTLAHLRKYYNESPPAFFILTDTDKKSFAKYEVELGIPLGEAPPAPEPLKPLAPAPAPPVIPAIAPPTPPTPPAPPATPELLEAERRLLEERRKSMERELELIKEWKSLGLSEEEIKERLKKFREGGEM